MSIALRNILHDGVEYPKGSTLPAMDQDQLEQLVEIGAATDEEGHSLAHNTTPIASVTAGDGQPVIDPLTDDLGRVIDKDGSPVVTTEAAVQPTTDDGAIG